MKHCSKCSRDLSDTSFSPDKRTRDGLACHCKECRRVTNKEYRERNAEKLQAKNRAWYLANRESELVRHRIKYRKQVQNPMFVERKRETTRLWHNKNKLRQMSHVVKRRAIKNGNGVFLVTVRDIKRIKSSACIYCGSREEIQVEHVMPLSRGGRHAKGNIAPACRKCNLSKYNKTVMEWRLTA